MIVEYPTPNNGRRNPGCYLLGLEVEHLFEQIGVRIRGVGRRSQSGLDDQLAGRLEFSRVER